MRRRLRLAPPSLPLSYSHALRCLPTASLPPTSPRLPAQVHVKDVAAAHIAAAETPAAGGQRYMMIAWWGHLAEQCAALRKAAPGLKGIPSEVDLKEGEAMAAPKGQDSSKVTHELGIQLRGLEECMADSVASLIEHGLVGVE